jgi:hypothetical protein
LVAGVHGTGKSFYLNKLVEVATSTNCVGVVVICPEGQPYDQARSILLEIVKALEVQVSRAGSPPSKELSTDFEKNVQSQLFSSPRRVILTAGDLVDDFTFLAERARAADRDGVVVCIDEGQRIARALLSSLKNALSAVRGVLIVLSWRLASDAKGAVLQAREELINRVSDTEEDKDIGAASFFTSATAMGPFKTDEEVAGYFRARLAGNPITFASEVSSRLGEIANRVPRPMTELAHDVYEAAQKRNMVEADPSLLTECFRIRYPREVKRAADLCADLSPETMNLLEALCRYAGPASALDLVKQAFPLIPTTHQALMANGVASQLDKLCQSAAILQKTDDKYGIVDSVSRYALKSVLGLA